MQTWKKIFIGGLGALTPIIMNLLVVDLDALLADLTGVRIAGYLLRVIILFYLGGIIAYLHKSENSPVKLFELGIVAPALITAMLNASNITLPKDKGNGATSSTSSIIISTAIAQPEGAEQKKFSFPKRSTAEQLWQGVTGAVPHNLWFVIVDSFDDLDFAKKQAGRINKAGVFKADVYEPYGDNKNYSVVIGENLERGAAEIVKQRAIEAGFSNTNIWTFPSKKE